MGAQSPQSEPKGENVQQDQAVTGPGSRTFHGVSGETLTIGHDEDGDPWAEPAVTESGERVASVYRADEPEPWQ